MREAFVSVPQTFHFDVAPVPTADPPVVLAPRSAAVAHLQAENLRLRALANRLTTDNATLAARLDAAEERGAGGRLSAGWHHLPDVIGAEIRRREEASAERVHVTKEWLTEKIAGSLEQAIKAAHYPGIGRLGELLARLHGLITEKRDIRVIRSIEDLTDEELAAVEMTGRCGVAACWRLGGKWRRRRARMRPHERLNVRLSIGRIWRAVWGSGARGSTDAPSAHNATQPIGNTR